MHKSCAVLGMLVLVVAGCSRQHQDPNYPDVTGMVKLDGQPLAGAAVVFLPTGGNVGNNAYGTTDETGRYKLQGGRGSTGAGPGDYKVTISHMLLPNGKPPPPDAPKAASGAQESLPPHYSDPMKTTLSATVGKDGGNFDFALKRK